MILRTAGVYRRPRKTLGVVRKGDELSLLGIISHFRNYPRQDGTLLSAVGTEGRPLQNGRCYVLDGSNDKVTFATPSEFSGQALNSFDCTLSTWAKFDSISSFEALVCLGSFDLEIAPTSATEVGIWVNNAAYGGAVYAPTMGQWNHYTATKSGNTYTLYVDGVQIGQNVDADNGTIGGSSFLGTNSATNYFHGSLYDARIYNTTLTAAQVATVLGGGDVNGLVAQYKCDEQEGLTAYDSSGNGNHGTITNATLSSFHGTQGEYSFQNQVGYSRAFTEDDTLIVAGLTLTTINFTIDLMGETGDLALFSDSASSNLFVISSGGAGGLSNLSGTPTYTIDGVAFAGTRGELYTLLAVAGPHTATITLSHTLDLYVGGFNSSAWGVDGQVISNVKVNGIAYDGPTYLPRNESTPSQDVLGNALQHRGMAKLIAKARENNCGTFDGSSDFVSLTSASLRPAVITIATWVNFSKTSSGAIWQSGNSDAYATNNTQIRLDSGGSGVLQFFGRTNATSATTTTVFTTGDWYHVCIVADGTDYQWYVNGVAEGTSPAGVIGTDNATGEFIGKNVTEFLGGNLSDFRVYDDALTSNEVTHLATWGTSGTDPTDTNLVAHYPLSEGNGTVIHDVSPNANHGTATNITQSSFWGTTQDEYATNFVDGFTPYFTEEDTLIVAGQTLTSISFTIDLMGETGKFIVLSNGWSSYLLATDIGSTSIGVDSGFGTPTYTVDGATFAGTRAELYTILAVTGSHDVTITTSTMSDLYFGGFNSPSWAITNQVISNLVVNGVAYDGPTRVPAKSSTLDAYGNALTNPPSPTHNDFEGVIDYREVAVDAATPPALDNIYTGAAEFDGVSGSYVSTTSGGLDMSRSWDLEVDFVPDLTLQYNPIFSDISSANEKVFYTLTNGNAEFTFGAYVDGTNAWRPINLSLITGVRVVVKFSWDGVDTMTCFKDGVSVGTKTLTAPSSWTTGFELGRRAAGHSYQIGSTHKFSYADGVSNLDIDFRKFNHKLRADYATSGQLVTLNGGVSFPKVIVPDALAYDDTYPKDYCEFDGVSGSYVSVPDAANLNGLTDFVMEARDVYQSDWTTGLETFCSKYDSTGGGAVSFVFGRHGVNAWIYAVYAGVGTTSLFAHGLTGAATASIRITRVGTSLSAEIDTGSGYVAIGTAQTISAAAVVNTTTPIGIGSYNSGTGNVLTGKIGSVKLTSSGTTVLDIDFSTANARNNLAETGQILTYNGGAAIPLSTLANPMFQRDDSWTRLFEVGLNDSDAAKQI